MILDRPANDDRQRCSSPLGDDNSQVRTFPAVVCGLIAVNTAVWLLQQQLGEPFSNAWAAVPYEITQHVDLVGIKTVESGGQSFPIHHYAGPHPLWLTLFSSMFMHGSWMHIIGNMLYLWIFGDQIEDRLGHFRFLLFYLACGLAAGLAHTYSDPQSMIPCLGASGAIAGVLGAYLVLHPANGVRVFFIRSVIVMPAWIVLGFWIGLQFLNQFAIQGAHGGVAYMAHIGGFIAGAVLVFVFAIGRRAPG